MQINSCSDDCGYCSLNEEIIIDQLCPGKYFAEITGFSQLDYGDYSLALKCGGNDTITTNSDAINSGVTDSDNGGAYYVICGFIVVSLCCLTVSISIVTNNKKRRIALKRGEIQIRQRLEYDTVDTDDLDDDDVVPKDSLLEGGEEAIDSEVERNIIKYNVNRHTIVSDDDGNPPVAFGNGIIANNSKNIKMDKIDEDPEIEDGENSWFDRNKYKNKRIPEPVSFELLHHEFNPSFIRNDQSKKNKKGKDESKEESALIADDGDAEAV